MSSVCWVDLQWRRNRLEGEKVGLFLSQSDDIRKIHEGDRGSAGGDLINFPFCLVNLRRCGIFARANWPLDFFLSDARRRGDTCFFFFFKSAANISFLFPSYYIHSPENVIIVIICNLLISNEILYFNRCININCALHNEMRI